MLLLLEHTGYGLVLPFLPRLIVSLYKVEMLPWMRHIPSFLAPWKRTVEEWNREDSDAFVSYFDVVQKTVV